MPSVAIIVSSAAISGGTNVIFEHAMRLPSHGFQVTLITRDPVTRDDVSWHRIGQYFDSDIIRWETFSTASSLHFDYAIATYWRTFFDLWRIDAASYLYFVQSIESRFYPLHERVLRNAVDGTYDSNVGFITEANWIVEYLKAIHEADAALALNGIDKNIFSLSGASIASRRPNTFRILVEGSVTAEFKNIPRTIELCQAAGVGEVWLLTPSKVEVVPGVDRVFSQIPMAETASVYRSCDVLVKLSLVEGVFGPPLEMFHCGGTAIVYNVTGHDEYIVHGKNALVVPTHDEKAVIDYLRLLAQEPPLLAHLKQNAMQTAAAYPDWDICSEAFAKAIALAGTRATTNRSTLRMMARRLWHSYEANLREKAWENRQHLDAKRPVFSPAQLLSVEILFDQDWYLSRNPDVAHSGANPIQHYFEFGASEGRNPHPLFDTKWYLSQYPDVTLTETNPLLHFIEFGANEGRSPGVHFNTAWYLEQNPDVARSKQNPLQHYLLHGGFEGRNPSPDFNSAWYLRNNPDVTTNPLLHFTVHGKAEGRKGRPD